MNQATKLSRRQFLKLSAATVGAAALAGSMPRLAGASGGSSADDAKRGVGPAMLIDLSRCVGCGNCQRSCIAASDLHPTIEQTQGLNANTLTFVDQRDLEGGQTRWIKRQCMHCLDAACASACPVKALYKTPEGPIAYRPDRCLGCRYCMASCPFGLPSFEWNNGLTPEIRKCMFCYERQQNGELPACAANCPSGALKFGSRGALLQEAHSRIASNPGHYVDHVYGEQEAGGTAMLYISDVPFAQLGFRTDVSTRALPGYTWDVMSKLPVVVGSLAVVLTGASIITRLRNGKDPEHDIPPWERTKKEDTDPRG